MFTIRVERSGGGRTVYSAQTYRVDQREGSAAIILDDGREIDVPAQGRAYVMNATGYTVDCVMVQRPPRTASLRTT